MTRLVDRDWLQQELKTRLGPVMGVVPAEVECPAELAMVVGATTRCTVTTTGGSRTGVTVTVTSVEGDAGDEEVSLWLKIGTPLLLGQDALEPELRDLFEAVMGVAPARVECPAALAAEVGATTRCTFTARDGSRYDVTVTVTSMDGTDFRFRLKGLPEGRLAGRTGAVPYGRRGLERKVSATLEEVLGVAPARVECPAALAAEVGATAHCTVTTSSGHRWDASVTVTQVREDGYRFWVQIERLLTVGRAWLERHCSATLEEVLGVAPAGVECPEALAAEVGATTRCILTAQDDSRVGLTATVTKLEGDTIGVDYQVDDKPMS